MKKKYRKNVGAVIINNRSNNQLFFAGQRIDIFKHVDLNAKSNENCGWQFPQGGIEANEDTDNAIYREIFEETGIKKDKIKLLKKMPKCLLYDFPIEILKKNKGTRWENYAGQEQYWYIFDFLGKDEDINLNATNEKQEFIKWEWKTSEFMIKNIVEFKKDVYRELFVWMKSEKLIKN